MWHKTCQRGTLETGINGERAFGTEREHFTQKGSWSYYMNDKTDNSSLFKILFM